MKVKHNCGQEMKTDSKCCCGESCYCVEDERYALCSDCRAAGWEIAAKPPAERSPDDWFKHFQHVFRNGVTNV